jgi:hypothetical protein
VGVQVKNQELKFLEFDQLHATRIKKSEFMTSRDNSESLGTSKQSKNSISIEKVFIKNLLNSATKMEDLDEFQLDFLTQQDVFAEIQRKQTELTSLRVLLDRLVQRWKEREFHSIYLFT